MKHMKVLWIGLIFMFGFSCEKKDEWIVPDTGYDWPSNARSYWPTEEWKTAEAGISVLNENRLVEAIRFAEGDQLIKAVLVVKNGEIAYEDYFNGGGIELSTNLWSCTKSVASALTGIVFDQGHFNHTDENMIDLLPHYQDFENITLKNVLTHTTGLNWAEEGPLWVKWIKSEDWVQEALDRGYRDQPGQSFYYSSGNSHMLSKLVNDKMKASPGEVAKQYLFDPMGIHFTIQDRDLHYDSWEQYIPPLPQSWRTDNQGIECAGFGLYLTARDMAKFGYLYLNRGKWDDQQLISEDWIIESTKDHVTDVYDRYSYGYQWYLTLVDDEPSFLASGFGGQIIGVVPSLDMVIVLKYEAEAPVHPKTGSKHDDMYLFELLVRAAK